MDSNNFSDDSEEGNYDSHFSQSPNYHLLDILSDEKNPFLDEQIYDSDDSATSSHLSPVQSKFQQTQNHISENEESENLQHDHEKTEKNPIQVKKTKPIQKLHEPTKNGGKKIPKASVKTKGNKSKYNNMGGFLIGSLSYILNNRFAYRFVNAYYEVQFEGKWTQISKIKVSSERPFLQGMKRLKKQIDDLPRREGSKQHLFRLINNQPKDSDLRKEFKRLVRQELLLSMKNEDWLKMHADSRDFKPNNDQDGSKKKQRHEAYFTYLNAIKQALMQKDELPKRLSL